ncbi:MAG: hypothetical protein ACREBS_08250 [Nitrososphaerales archaeon]
MTEVREMLKSIKQTKKKIIFMSSHLLGEVSDVCDEIAMVDKGKLLIYDTVENAAAKFAVGSRIVHVGFSRSIELGVVQSIVTNIESPASIEKLNDRNVRVRFSGDLKTQEEIASELTSAHLGLINFESSSYALEDAYLNLVSKEEV